MDTIEKLAAKVVEGTRLKISESGVKGVDGMESVKLHFGRHVFLVIEGKSAYIQVHFSRPNEAQGWRDLPYSPEHEKRAVKETTLRCAPWPGPEWKVVEAVSLKDRGRVRKLRQAAVDWILKTYEADQEKIASDLKAVNLRIGRLINPNFDKTIAAAENLKINVKRRTRAKAWEEIRENAAAICALYPHDDFARLIFDTLENRTP